MNIDLHKYIDRPRMLELLINAGADINRKRLYGYTLLADAVGVGEDLWKGSDEYIKMLLDAGADTEVRDHSDYTPLLRASFTNRPNVVRILLDAKADVNGGDLFKAIHDASFKGNISIVRMLLDAGADPN